MAVLLAIGTTAASSADFTLTGESSCLLLVATAALEAASTAAVEMKSNAGVYYKIGALTADTPLLVLNGPGTYRVSRLAGASLGVDRT